MNSFFRLLGNGIARYITKPLPRYEVFSNITEELLEQYLQPGDLLLIEGNSRVSTAIKYLTQSTWSHVCLYIGEREGLNPLLEADLIGGIMTVPLSKYEGFNLRICRPVNLSEADLQQVLDYAIKRIGLHYDTKNIIDLMRYLFPMPPVPTRFRRKMIALGSGDPTKAICSTLVAQAFQSIKYPILPREIDICAIDQPALCEQVYLEKKHFSHFTPRDFDLSPYFQIVKPTLQASFNYKVIKWQED
ncbi:MAG: YiiX/YebB-like N1pC/P60 family cysteine hydrolase [Spongiibacteraceae bacterium]